MKTVTCQRCNGTGHKGTPVAHMGVPGLCFACDGSGNVVSLTKAERASLVVSQCEVAMVEAQRKGEVLKMHIANAEHKGRQRRVERLTAELESCRESYRIYRDRKCAAVAGELPKGTPAKYASRYRAMLEKQIKSGGLA